MQVSHSRVECFKNCPRQYKFRYLDKIKMVKADNPDNALFLGTALHTGLEKDVDAAINEYFAEYPIITDDHINEAIKLEIMIPKAKEIIPDGINEVKIETPDFIGYIDLLAPVKTKTRLNGEYQDIPGQYDLFDFKYSNQVSHYKDSVQIHLYKYFYEKTHPGEHIKNLYYLIVPKVRIKQGKTESLQSFRKRIQQEAENSNVQLLSIDYDPQKVTEWFSDVKQMLEAKDFPQQDSWLCRYCDYEDICKKGCDLMVLPKNERRDIKKVTKKVLWIYGSPFSGKTTFANKFPDPLMLNTDGNIKFVDAPYIPIKDDIQVEGRITKRTLAWEVFKDAISELEKKQNDFKTIILDLVEDTYEQCRLYMYDQMGITHESDDSFRAWDKVRTEFLSTLKRLMNLDYENIILISHEDTSRDITKKTGDKITAIKPNLQEKTANKVAGMVDIVARVIADGDVRTLSFKSNEIIFGGGRLLTKVDEIPLDYDAFLKVYEDANSGSVASPIKSTKKAEKPSETPSEEAEKDDSFPMNTPEEDSDEESAPEEVQQEEAPKTRTRTRTRRTEPEEAVNTEDAPKEDAPKVRTRTRKNRD